MLLAVDVRVSLPKKNKCCLFIIFGRFKAGKTPPFYSAHYPLFIKLAGPLTVELLKLGSIHHQGTIASLVGS